MTEPHSSQIDTSYIFPFTSMHVVRDKRMTVIGRDMDYKFVGPIDPSKFLDEFLPSHGTTGTKESRTRNWLNNVGKLKDIGSGPGISAEKDMYDPLINALAEFCPSLQLINTDDADNINWAHQPRLFPQLNSYLTVSVVSTSG